MGFTSLDSLALGDELIPAPPVHCEVRLLLKKLSSHAGKKVQVLLVNMVIGVVQGSYGV